MRVYKIEELTKNSKTMYISKCKVTDNMPPHTHDFIEIVYILSGKMTQIIDGQSYNVSRGDLLFMNYGCTHSFLASEVPDTSYVNILFSPETISESITPSNALSLLALTSFNALNSDGGYGILTFTGEERRCLENIVLSMHAEFKGKDQGWEDVVKNYFNILLTYMLRKSNNLGIEEVDGSWRELLKYIEENLETKLSLAGLAQKCFYNPSYFSRMFKEKFGMPLMEYITYKRLDKAAELLTSSTLSVDDICRNVGFSDRSGFYHAFSRRFGIAPQQYRKSVQK